jgi:integration host factor subunit alpha
MVYSLQNREMILYVYKPHFVARFRSAKRPIMLNFALTLKCLYSILCSVEEGTMTKADIISEVFDKVGLPKQDAEELVEMILDLIKQTLKEGETVKLSGFGNFVVRKKNSRKGRNPKTGQEIEITPRKVVSFRPSMIFKEHVIESSTTAAAE